ncbi:MAG: super-infection exclusion protein B [Negativicutes bacterium]
MGMVRMFLEELSISYTALFMFFGSAALLSFSDKLQKDPVIQPWIVDYHPYIWILLLASGLYLVVSTIVNLIKGVGRMWRRARKEKIFNEVMRNLTQEDMEILTLFYNCVDHTVRETIELNLLDSKVQRLEDKGVILSLAFSGVSRSDCPTCPMIYMINPKAKEFLLKTALKPNL